ncbi:4804_t:CDS:2 [Paraglomus occultum]|uniref:4804_t:CDS:1 n=1 Tax=Paraglomus occultum TaxID=144539 RepID=A0A9N9F3Y3_9GLOM|nr:4804_t:CDS:2 [Paraglomus occultum]
MLGSLVSRLPEEWAKFISELTFADVTVAIPAILVIYAVIPSALYTMRHRSGRGGWYIPPKPLTQSPTVQAKLFLLNSLAVLFTVKYIAQYTFGHPAPEVFVTGALLTVVLITVIIYHFENKGIVKPALPLFYVWGLSTVVTLYYTLKSQDITQEIYLITSLLLFLLEWASPHSYNGKGKSINKAEAHTKSE